MENMISLMWTRIWDLEVARKEEKGVDYSEILNPTE